MLVREKQLIEHLRANNNRNFFGRELNFKFKMQNAKARKKSVLKISDSKSVEFQLNHYAVTVKI